MSNTRRCAVESVTISPKFQVVIPKSIREQLHLVPGQKVQAIAYGGRIELIPVRPARELRGVLRGLDTGFERDREDRV
jgi:AbrB family looped-hinge helix DNA binding protein